MELKTTNKETERVAANALKKQEVDRVVLEEMKDKIGRVTELEGKLAAS